MTDLKVQEEKKSKTDAEKFDTESKVSYYEGVDRYDESIGSAINARDPRLDRVAKEILSYAIFQAAILQSFFKEFKDKSLNELETEILRAISGGKIWLLNPNFEPEGYRSIIYDILYKTEEDDVATGIVDVEVQGYMPKIFKAFKNRVSLYKGVLQMYQRGKSFLDFDFEQMIKAFSLWIVTIKVPGYSGIYRYDEGRFVSEDEYIEDEDNIATAVVVFLDYDINAKHPGLRLLNILFTKDLSASEKEVLLKDYFKGLKLEIKELLREMCTYSIGVFNDGFAEGKTKGFTEGIAKGIAEGIAEGKIQNTVTLMQDLGFPKDAIIKRLITDFNCDELQANTYYDKYSEK